MYTSDVLCRWRVSIRTSASKFQTPKSRTFDPLHSNSKERFSWSYITKIGTFPLLLLKKHRTKRTQLVAVALFYVSAIGPYVRRSRACVCVVCTHTTYSRPPPVLSCIARFRLSFRHKFTAVLRRSHSPPYTDIRLLTTIHLTHRSYNRDEIPQWDNEFE